MPLRDHSHTKSTLLAWEGLLAFWLPTIVARLNSVLPLEYVARPRLHTGAEMELDVGALGREASDPTSGTPDGGGVAVAAWAPAALAVFLDTEFPEPSEYEVNIYTQDEFRVN